MRLVGSSGSSEGRLEVQETFSGGDSTEWSTVCSTNFTASEAQVVCNQLGFSGGAQAVRASSFFSPGTTSYILEFGGSSCKGSEASLDSCTRWIDRSYSTNAAENYYNYCERHANDVGVICNGNKVPLAAIVVPVVVGAVLLAAAGAWFVLRRKNQQKAGAGAGGAEEGTMVTIPALTAPPAAVRVGEATAPAPVPMRVGEASAAEPMAVRVGEASSAAPAAVVPPGDGSAVQSTGSGLSARI